MEIDMTLPAGEYYIGDLCYVLGDRWGEVCNLIINGQECVDGEFTLPDGTRFASYGTAWGDGLYEDDLHNSYGVDAGLIGCVLVSDIAESQRKNLKDGHVHVFDRPFLTGYLDPHEARPGKIFFGFRVIDTDPDYVEDSYDIEEEDL
jgi:hypothetical protein